MSGERAPLPVTLRSYEPSDAGAAAGFLTASAELDGTLHPCTEPEWVSFVAQSYNREGADFMLATDASGAVVGLLTSTSVQMGACRHFRIIVHPERRREGVGTRLLAVVEGQDAPRGTTLQSNVRDAWAAGARFLEEHAYRAVREDLSMRREGKAPDPIDGPVVRADRADPADDTAWTRLNEEGYAGSPDYHPFKARDLEVMRAEPGFGLWFAEADGEVVGLCHVKRFGGEAWINSVVVRTARRRRGVGRALVVHALRTLAERGMHRVQLSVYADNTRAAKLYESLGFRTFESVSTWRKERPPLT